MSLNEKQNLRELAALVMGSMEDRRQKKLQTAQHMSKLIACTAHDLLTPLSGVQLSLSLLRDDPLFLDVLRPCHRELVENASSCCEMVTKVCDDLVTSFKSNVDKAAAKKQDTESSLKTKIMEVKRHQINIPEFVQNIKMVIETYPKTVPLYITIDPEVPTTIVSDDLKIFRSVINYLTNACNVTKKGCIQLRIFIKRNFPAKTKRSLIFECQDTGPGVLEEKYPYLFRPILEDDYNLDDVSCVGVDSEGKIIKRSSVCFKSAPSAGLGLYSVAASISSIGGRYGFFPRSMDNGATENKSQPSSSTGSVFWFSVPLVLPDPYESQDKARQAKVNTVEPAESSLSQHKGRQAKVNTFEPAESSLSQPIVQRAIAREEEKNSSLEFLLESFNIGAVEQNIEQRPRTALVIDDSLVIRKSLSRALGNLEFRVRDAKDGLEGLKTLQSDVFDIVLCDFLMPVMDGLDCIQQYRSWEKIHRPWYRQYIIGISAHATERDSLRGIECGMDSFLSKPVTLDVVKQLVKDEKLLHASKLLDNVFDKNNVPESLNFATDLPVPGSETGLSCLIAEASKNVSLMMSKAAESKGWIAVVVEDGNKALSLMKSRNWNSVFISDDLPKLAGLQCIDEFRQWEKDNRVAKQKNVILVCNYCVAPPSSTSTGRSCAVFPIGFDGALSTPIDLRDFHHWLGMASNNWENDILLR
jgi:CheY-like chemotaxis protein